ncbi:hypothetical protein [Bradyrhizobium elkanii]|uniref:hypothetical protein n=1 Tax=Bradyrhizobium elkanii TaxID=29448 RepID=UPI00272D245F|nr:hypothetical protein [Bradyrhizobium elkanii]WLA80257.1 hypothetical protein QNJ99_33455 [Bradyrhizobium elkanii]
MSGKRYYGSDAPRSTGPHPDPLDELYEARAEAREKLELQKPKPMTEVEALKIENGSLQRRIAKQKAEIKRLSAEVISLSRRWLMDDAAGMIWWNALDKAQRKHWMEVAGNTGRAVDAWRAFCSQASVKGEADQ